MAARDRGAGPLDQVLAAPVGGGLRGRHQPAGDLVQGTAPAGRRRGVPPGQQQVRGQAARGLGLPLRRFPVLGRRLPAVGRRLTVFGRRLRLRRHGPSRRTPPGLPVLPGQRVFPGWRPDVLCSVASVHAVAGMGPRAGVHATVRARGFGVVREVSRVVVGPRPSLLRHHAVSAGPAVALRGLVRFPRPERGLGPGSRLAPLPLVPATRSALAARVVLATGLVLIARVARAGRLHPWPIRRLPPIGEVLPTGGQAPPSRRSPLPSGYPAPPRGRFARPGGCLAHPGRHRARVAHLRARAGHHRPAANRPAGRRAPRRETPRRQAARRQGT